MATASSTSPIKDSLNSMKRWILTKLNASTSYDVGSNESNDGASRTTIDKSIPQILISNSSERSINRIPTSPLVRRPHPLTKTWRQDSRPDSGTRPKSAPHDTSKQSFWNSPKLPWFSVSGNKPGSASVPATPLENADVMPSPSFRSDTTMTKSPIFRFSQRHNIPIGNMKKEDKNNTNQWSRSNLDSPTICGECGQRKFNGSREFVGFSSSCRLNVDNALNKEEPEVFVVGAASSINRSHLRRVSSCKVPDKKIEKMEISAKMKKASSNFDIEQKGRSRHSSSISSKNSSIKQNNKKKSKSVIALSMSMSINADSFRIVRNNISKTESFKYNSARKMSLNDNELRRLRVRRGSSLVRLLCMNSRTNSEQENNCSETESEVRNQSDEDLLEYSPKVTRHHNVNPMDIRSTFETESLRIPSSYGQIKLMFQFFNEKNALHVTLLKGANIGQQQRGNMGIFASICLMPGKLQKRASDERHNTHDPVMYEMFVFRASLGELLDRQLRIKFYDKPGVFSRTRPIGECLIPLYPYDLTAVTVIWKNLSKCKNQKVRFHIF
ncbi:hypothetical protein DPMN_169551 [Dreissena polymorpha]|uniref:C2 domain-containing protein n=1 Tax=Dreissena polymorpha TaxID=45954 RepID=A0A9D4DUV6_DREPO|nr:hypothetical protein DPMN_169551 [Dreissena polymorpha]